jgi:hypothetical protein
MINRMRLFQRSFLCALSVSAVRKFTAEKLRPPSEDIDFARAYDGISFPCYW